MRPVRKKDRCAPDHCGCRGGLGRARRWCCLGTYGRLPAELEGFIVALAGGALMVSAVLELIDPLPTSRPSGRSAPAFLPAPERFQGSTDSSSTSSARTAAAGSSPLSPWTASRRTWPSGSRSVDRNRRAALRGGAGRQSPVRWRSRRGARIDPMRRRGRRRGLPCHRSVPQSIQGGQLHHRDRHRARTCPSHRTGPTGLTR